MPVKQHPVPQHISSYEFRLVGDMTLKQFGQLAGGVLVALFFYALPLNSFFKWPLVGLSAFMGFALAFVPIEETPLSTWIMAFAKSVFAPTMFVWDKQTELPDMFKPIIHTAPLAQKTTSPADTAQLNAYLKTLPSSQISNSEESPQIKKILNLFESTSLPADLPSAPTPVIVPLAKPVIAPAPKPQFQPRPEPVESAKKPNFVYSQEIKAPRRTQPVFLPSDKSIFPRKVVIPFAANLPFPAPPTRPNLLAGMVLDQREDMIENAIIEIRNKDGLPVRALKTNKLGQFMIATPLENGVYELETEKDGFTFDIMKIEAKGEIINPIKIKAKPKDGQP